ncbi:hypothetical protein [Nocardia sp. IFM 10818]
MSLYVGSQKLKTLNVGARKMKEAWIWNGSAWRKVYSSKAFFSDSFDRASLGSDWRTVPFGEASIVPGIVANRMRAGTTSSTNTNNIQGAFYTRPVTSDSFAVRARVATGLNGLSCGLALRMPSTNASMVYALLSTGSGYTGIWSMTGGKSTRQRSDSTSSFSAGDIAEFRVVGNVYTLIRNPDTTNQVVSTWTDSGNTIPTGQEFRYGGLLVQSDKNFFGTQNWSADLDDFSIRDL